MTHRYFPLLISLFALTIAKAALACPACPPVLEPTWSERYAKADVAFLGKWIKANRAKGDAKAESTFEVLQVARNLDKRFKKGDRISMPRYVAGEAGLLFFVTGHEVMVKADKSKKDAKTAKTDSAKPAKKTLEWYEPFEVTEPAFHYITQAPSPEESNTKRLKYYLKFFEFPDKAIADDAFNEFAVAPFKDVKAIAGSYSRKDLHQWLSDKGTTPTRLGLYGLMLGLCGNDKDAEFLKSKFEKNTRKFRMGLEGMIAGYLLIIGDKGLDVVDKLKFTNKEVPDGEFLMAMQGLRIIDTYGKEIVSTDRLKQSFRLMLNRPATAELVVPDLARFEDWTQIDRLVKLIDDKAYDSPTFRQAVIRFLMAAKKDRAKKADATPPHVRKAEQHLAMLKKKYPKNYKFVQQSLFEIGE